MLFHNRPNMPYRGLDSTALRNGIEIIRKFPTAARDAVPETLLRAWRYRDSLKEGAPLRPWLSMKALSVS
jgi:hypothetical protein